MLKDLLDFLNYKLIDTKNIDLRLYDILFLLLVLMATTIILRFIKHIVNSKLEKSDKNKFTSIFRFVEYFTYILVVMLTLKNIGVNINVFLTASAAFFVGIGLALQTFFQDIISGILIILDKSLHVGDIIQIDDRVGRVTEIKLRSTRMVTRNDRVIIIPNHKFMTDMLFNWTQNNHSNREQVSVGVAYGSDVEKVKNILQECAATTQGVLKEYPITVLFEDFADSSLNFSVYFYVEDGMQSPKIQSDIRFKINHEFTANNITIPFPQRDVYLKQV